MNHYLYKVVFGIKNFFEEHIISLKGQKNNYRILQVAHRIEKGLTNTNPKILWGG